MLSFVRQLREVRSYPGRGLLLNQLDGDLIFPNDPTIMGANVNNAPIPNPPFKKFPPGYKDFQSPIPTVAHLITQQ